MIKEIGKILAERQVSIIGMTSIGENALAKLSDCVLNITTREGFTQRSQISQLIRPFATYWMCCMESSFRNIMKKSSAFDRYWHGL